MTSIHYTYKFSFPTGREEPFQLQLDGRTLEPCDSLPAELPDWTALEFNQCTECPLSRNDNVYCPLAARLSPIVDQLSDISSIDEVKVSVTMDGRLLSYSTTAQEGIRSLMGVVIATSGCPVTAFFKPMARFHLPFSSPEETFYRAASMYMLGQYYRWQNNLSADMDMKGLLRFYAKVASVNKGMADRIRANKREDGAINAIVLLDMFVQGMPYELGEILNDMQPLFAAYLEETNII
ncbi:MAG: hypothetical protein WCX90_09345 [Thiohalomonadaceae bacterium]